MGNDEAFGAGRTNPAGALASPERLGAADLALAKALGLLADGRYPQACAAYQQLVARAPTDFLAWFRLGKSQRRDKPVQADAGSPSQWPRLGMSLRPSSAYSRLPPLVLAAPAAKK